MPSFGEQLEAARQSHTAASLLEGTVRQQISTAFDEWDNGNYTDHSVRYKLEAIIRSAYKASAATARASAINASGVPGWVPKASTDDEYLDALIKDARRNLRIYKKSSRNDSDRKRAVLRMQHSAGVAAERGYTDSLIASFADLVRKYGVTVKKVWLANLVNNTPCAECFALHGTMVELHEVFPVPTKSGNIYINLQGPPRHPRCRCYLAILIVGLENTHEELDVGSPALPKTTMTTDEVKSLPKKIFDAIVFALKKVRDAIRRRSTNG